LRGNLIGGFWFVMIGIFLRSAAEGGYQQALIKGTLEGVKVKELMSQGVISVPPSLRVDRLVEDYYLTHKHITYPVTEGDKIVGIITLKRVKEIPRDQWATTKASDLLDPECAPVVLRPDEEAVEALRLMLRTDQGRLPVYAHGRLVGMITRRDIMDLLQIKTDLGE